MENDFGNYIDRGFTYDKERILGAPPKEKTLVVDGCSMAGGLDDNGDYLDIGLNLAKKWNFDCLTLNMPAKSNCSIYRDTTNFLLFNHKKLDISLEKIFLIVEWSGLARYSYFNREKMGWDIYHLIVGDDEVGWSSHPGKNLDYHSIIEEYMNRFLYQISVANLCENLGVNYIMYNGCDDIKSYENLGEIPTTLAEKIKNYFKENKSPIYQDFDDLYEILLTKNFFDTPCSAYFGYKTGRYEGDKDRLKKYTHDGLHMNVLGHQVWEKMLEDYIIEKGMGDFIK